MPPKSSKKPSTVPKSPPKPRRSERSGRKRARSSLDATVAPPSKKVAVENEGEIEGEDGGDEGGATIVKEKKGKGIKYEKFLISKFTAKIDSNIFIGKPVANL